ncbi:unnamed protein product [Ranitomeya imitator]|uniref:RBR-type E3 ubiquitin transferase n=1 Tax=Ranitomeya imitator TaxID=111125 RepID=A0ABN9LSX9_9NEOB|nr:unnamed protein product [Ranitomeya imitator]
MSHIMSGFRKEIAKAGHRHLQCSSSQFHRYVIAHSDLNNHSQRSRKTDRRPPVEREVLLDPCRTWCPSSSCQAVCKLQEKGPQNAQLVQCTSCDIEFCSSCKSNWHPGQGCQENMPITFLPGESRAAGPRKDAVAQIQHWNIDKEQGRQTQVELNSKAANELTKTPEGGSPETAIPLVTTEVNSATEFTTRLILVSSVQSSSVATGEGEQRPSRCWKKLSCRSEPDGKDGKSDESIANNVSGHLLATPSNVVLLISSSALKMVEDHIPIKRCPKCKVYIERDEGCAQMMCKNCKHAFCWYCLESLDDGNQGKHRDDFLLIHYDKGPCRNKLGHSRASVIWHRTQVIKGLKLCVLEIYKSDAQVRGRDDAISECAALCLNFSAEDTAAPSSGTEKVTIASAGGLRDERTILEENLLESTKDLRLGLRFVLQQDNDPKHKAKSTMEWFTNKRIQVREWPSQSPDLNPIENLWKELKTAVHKRSPSNLTELELFAEEEWTRISVSRCTKLIETYLKRLAAVITGKGGATKY